MGANDLEDPISEHVSLHPDLGRAEQSDGLDEALRRQTERLAAPQREPERSPIDGDIAELVEAREPRSKGTTNLDAVGPTFTVVRVTST